MTAKKSGKSIAEVVSNAPVIATGKEGNGTDEKAKRRRIPQRDNLMGLTACCELWSGEDGKTYATFPVNGHRENWPIRTEAFRRWLAARAYAKLGLVPGSQAVEDTLRILEARAANEGERRAPWLRVGERKGRLYIDLCDATWRAIEIRPDGWSVIENRDLPFIRSRAMQALPVPQAGYGIDELRSFVNVGSEDDFTLIVAWMVAALRNKGPYPILVIGGEQGTGKSTFTRIIRTLVDPNAAPIRAAPREERDLIVWAINGHVIAMDNLSKVSSELADGLCRLATGGGFSARQLHSNSEEHTFMGVRPIILNGIPSLTDRPDLADRSVSVRLVPIPPADRRPEDEMWEEWEGTAPRVLGALCDGLSAAVRRVASIRLQDAPRLADFAKWIAAAEPGLGWESGKFSTAYGANREALIETTFDSDSVAVAIGKLLETDECLEYGWEGTASDLLATLDGLVTDAAKRLRSWPQTAQALGNRIERIAPLLRAKRIDVERKYLLRERVIRICPRPT